MAIRETTRVETATRDDESQLVDTLVLAFDSDPIMRWFYPDPHDYLRYFPEFVRIYGGKAFDHGTAHYLPGGAGAALWLPPGVRPDEDAFTTLLQTSLPEEKQEQAWAVLEQVEECYPTEPFWHLPVIGVDPTQQGHGHGSALMAHALRACDDEGATAYLESSNPQNISLYVRHGFEILGTIQVGATVPLIPMVRKPQRLES